MLLGQLCLRQNGPLDAYNHILTASLSIIQGDSIGGGAELVFINHAITSEIGTWQHRALCNTDLAPSSPFRVFSVSMRTLLPCWVQRPPAWSVVSACLSRRRETNFSISCNSNIPTSTKVCLRQVSFLSVNYCVIYPSSLSLSLYMYIYIYIYRVSQEERSLFWEVIVSVILSKIVYMFMCPIPNGFRETAGSLYSTLYTVQTSNTPCPHTSCKVH
jgi:hypothetical protein